MCCATRSGTRGASSGSRRDPLHAVIAALLTAYGAVLLAELPDKSMFTTLVLTTRFRRPLAVWTGAVVAFAFHVVLAVTVGSFLERLPERPTRIGIGLMFLVGAVLIWREDGGSRSEDATGLPHEPLGAGKVALRSAAVLGVAEFGDLTQLATVGIAGSTGEPVAVALGAWAALATVAGVAALGGRWIERTLPLGLVRKVGAIAFAAFGIFAIASAMTG